MSVFPTADNLCSWGGACSGNNRSAGKTKSGRAKKANKFLRCVLGQAAVCAAKRKDCIYAAEVPALGEENGWEEGQPSGGAQSAEGGLVHAEEG